jgi:hypothetical protein
MDEQHSIAKTRRRLPHRDEHVPARSRRFSEAWHTFTREFDLQELQIDPEEVFAGVREQSPGRDVGL